MFVFRKIWCALFSCNTRFEILLLPHYANSLIFQEIQLSFLYAKLYLLIKMNPFYSSIYAV